MRNLGKSASRIGSRIRLKVETAEKPDLSGFKCDFDALALFFHR